jgi:hypothetical protein
MPDGVFTLKKLDVVDHLAGRHHVHQKGQCLDQVANRRLLRRVGDAAVMNPCRVQTEKVRVLCHRNPTLASGEREMYVVVSGMQTNVLSAHDVNSSPAQCCRHSHWDVLVHIELNAIIHRSSL